MLDFVINAAEYIEDDSGEKKRTKETEEFLF